MASRRRKRRSYSPQHLPPGAIFKAMLSRMVDTIGLSSRPVKKLQHIVMDGSGKFTNALLTAACIISQPHGTTVLTAGTGEITGTSGTLWSFAVTYPDSIVSTYEYGILINPTSATIYDTSGNGRHLVMTGFGVGNVDVPTALVESYTTGSDWLNQQGYDSTENLLYPAPAATAHFSVSAADADGYIDIRKITTTQYANAWVFLTNGYGKYINNAGRYIKLAIRKIVGASNTSVRLGFYGAGWSGHVITKISGPGTVSIVAGMGNVSGLSETEDTVVLVTKNNYALGGDTGDTGSSNYRLTFYAGGADSVTIGDGCRVRNVQIGEGVIPRDYTATLNVPASVNLKVRNRVSMGKLVLLGDSLLNLSAAGISALIPETTVVNAAIGGNTSAQMLARFQSDVIAVGATHCVLWAGANDMQTGVSQQVLQANVLAILQLADLHGVEITLATMSPAYGIALYHALYAETFNTWAATLGRRVAPVYAAWVAPDGKSLLDAYDSGDNLHPNALGASVAAGVIFNALPITYKENRGISGNTLSYPGRAKYSLLGTDGAYYWPSAPDIIAVTGVDNAVYNADGTGKTFATQALALAALVSLEDGVRLVGGTRGVAEWSRDLTASEANRANRYFGT